MRLLPLLRLLRIGTLFSPAADVVASICLAGLPWSLSAFAAVSASVCLYAAGMVWNDIADRRIDAVQRPERPLPSGALTVPFAVVLGVALLGLGLFVSPCKTHHGVIAALVLAYDFLGKRIDWLGALGMGALRGLNLATALALGGDAVTAAAQQAVLVAASCYAVYIVAVTILGIFEDEPRVAPRAVAAVQAAPMVAAVGALVSVQGGLWPAPALAAAPAVWILFRNARQRTWDQAAIRRSMTILLLGTMVYTALLALAASRPVEAVLIAMAIVPARWISRRIALT